MSHEISQDEIDVLERLIERVGLSDVVWSLGTIMEVNGLILRDKGYRDRAKHCAAAGKTLHAAAIRSEIEKVDA